MEKDLMYLLEEAKAPKEWGEISKHFSLQVEKYLDKEPVYQFFESVDDSLKVVPKPIAVSVNPVQTYVPFHLHNYVEMIIPVKGTCSFSIGKEDILVEEGEVIVIGPYTAHRNRELLSSDLVVNIALKSNAFSLSELELMRKNGQMAGLTSMFFFVESENSSYPERYMVFHSSEDKIIQTGIENIVTEYYFPDNQSNQIIRYELLALFSRLVRLSAKGTVAVKNPSNEDNHLLSFLLYIEENYAQVTLEDMGQAFGFNPSYLSTYLKKQTGKSFIKLVHLQRINVAADYLRYSQVPIDQIAAKVGYENPSYFYKIFKKTMGVSPAAFRNQF